MVMHSSVAYLFILSKGIGESRNNKAELRINRNTSVELECCWKSMPFPLLGDIWSHLIVTMIFNFSFSEKNILIKAGYKYQNYHEKQSHPC
jgi:hypothetical protein